MFVVKHPLEGTTHLFKSITSTAACSTAHPFKGGWASTTGSQDRGVQKRLLSRSKFQSRWHIITSQEASEYVDQELLKNRFHVHVAHHWGCAVLFNKDTYLLWCQSQFHLLSRYQARKYQARNAWWGEGKRFRLGFTGCAITCIFSSTTLSDQKHSRFCRCTSLTSTPRYAA